MKQSETLHQIIEVFNYMDSSFDAALKIIRDQVNPKFSIVNINLEWIRKLRLIVLNIT